MSKEKEYLEQVIKEFKKDAGEKAFEEGKKKTEEALPKCI